MQYKGLTLDPFQRQAVLAIENNKSVMVTAPTGSGKTLIADYLIDFHKKDPVRIVYTAPIKALSNQKYKEFTEQFGKEHVGLMTGDIVINPTAKVVIMTTEIYRNMVVSHDESVNDIAYVIFDEIHYINDRERGYVWEESIIYSPKTVRFLCLSATIPNAEEFADWIATIKEHTVETVVATHRHVPLERSFYDYELGITTLEKIKQAARIPQYRQVVRVKGRNKRVRLPKPNHIDLIRTLGEDKLPCLFFSFSRHLCQKQAQELARKRLFSNQSEAVRIFRKHLEDAPSDIRQLSSTRLLQETIPQGIAFHHAGLLPVLKTAVEDLFSQGLIRVLYTTETFAVGINMPAKTVCFTQLRKYDGISFRYLNTKEYFQIAGRAGRRGIDTVGYAIAMVERQGFQYDVLKRLTDKDVDPIRSQFRLSVNTVLNLIDRHEEKEIEQILRLSFFSFQQFGDDLKTTESKKILASYHNIVKRLQKYGFVQEGKLTPKGRFASRIFTDEIVMTELFASDIVHTLEVYDVLLFLGALVYEPRESHKFKKKFKTDTLKKLRSIIESKGVLKKEKKFLELPVMTTLLYPLLEEQTFFDVLKLTSLLEGDLIRIYTQITDRLGQLMQASDDVKVRDLLKAAKRVIDDALEGIYYV